MEDQESNEIRPQHVKFSNYGGGEDMVCCWGICTPKLSDDGAPDGSGPGTLPRMEIYDPIGGYKCLPGTATRL